MASFCLDSKLFRDEYGTPEMRAVFSDEALMQKWLDCWVALAEAEADVGMIPKKDADHIKACAKWQNMDFDKIAEGFKVTSHPLMPQINEFSRICGPEAGRWVHWGATTQDIMDTAFVLEMKDAWAIVRRDVKELLKLTLKRAEENKNLAMAGRTHVQQAVPITLGYKFAVWADELGHHLVRMQEAEKRIFRGQLGGAAGTLASLGAKALEIRKGFCHYLGLEEPTITWHVARDGYAEYASIIAMIAGTIGQIANEIIHLQRTEVGEIEEGFSKGKIGSSTMPQKRNPMICENTVANVRTIQQNAALGFTCLVQLHERDMTYWQTEWSYIPQITILLSSCLANAKNVMTNMIIHKERIHENLHLTKGLIVSERCMLDLGQYLGRQTAHAVIHESCMTAFENNRPLLDVLLEDHRVTDKISKEELEKILTPETYTGKAAAMTDAVVEKWKSWTE